MRKIKTFYQEYRLISYVVIGVFITGILIFLLPQVNVEETPQVNAVQTEPVKEKKTDAEVTHFTVDVKGAVGKPDVYEIAIDARVKDVIHLAGGVTKKADTSQLNLAQKVVDQMVVNVPFEGDLPSDQVDETDAAPVKININQAKVTDFEGVPGIGAVKAATIISYREENGLFENIEALTNVTGIGDKTVERLKDYLDV